MEAPVSASQGAMRSLPGKLESLLSGPEHGLRPEEKNKLRILQGDLQGLIDNYLLEPSEVESPASTANLWMKDVRDLSYDIDDFLDELAQTGTSGSRISIVETQKLPRVKISRFPEKLKRRQWITDEISGFRTHVKEAIQRHKSYLGHCKWRPSSRSSGQMGEHPHPPSLFGIGLVGMESSIKHLHDLLANDGQPEHKVVSIVGTGGVGKTTLAKEVYRKLGGQFECRAFVRTSRKPDMKGLLTSLLSQVQGHHIPDSCEVHKLVLKINEHLQDKTYIIVIDDLWASSTWDIINHALPKGNCCSRILTTTEVDAIAQTCYADASKYMPSKKEGNSKYIFKKEPLNEDESRELLLSTVFGLQAGCPQVLKEVLNEIIKRSGGLPLTINILASLLARQPANSLEQWNYIKNSLSSCLTTNNSLEGINQVLNLAYDNLPHGLKACMLYLCMYEEGRVILKVDLVKQWMAEGFICAVEGDDAKEVAQSYFDELVNRGMIQPVDINCKDEILSYKVHHILLRFIRYKSIEENFSITIDHSQTAIRLADKVRRLAFHFGNVEDARPPGPVSMRLSKVRSLAFSGLLKCVPSIVEFRFLQVLILKLWADPDNRSDNLIGSDDLSGNITDPDYLTDNLTEPDDVIYNLTEISELFRLRYFHLDACYISVELPTQMQRLKDLIAWEIDAEVTAVPTDIVDLPGLLYLSIPSEAHLPTGIGHMTSLRTLGVIDLSKNSTENVMSLAELTNLQDLRFTCSTLQPDNLKKNLECLGSIIRKLSNLKCVTLVPAVSSHVNSQDDASASSMSISWHGFTVAPFASALLQRLELSWRCCIFSSLPEWTNELTKLCILKIAVRKLSSDDVIILRGLPSLTALSLFVWTVPVRKIMFNDEGFRALKYFKFVCAAPCLAFSDGAMTNVRILKLGFNGNRIESYNLVAAGFERLISLNEISAKIGGADAQYKRSAKSVLTDATSNHPRPPIINVKSVNWIFSGDDKKYIAAQKGIWNQTSGKKDVTTGERSYESLVSVSTGAMGSLLGKLGAMLTDEYKLLKDVRGNIKFLKDELEVMKMFLLKMSDVEEPDEPTKLRVTAVREMSYKIEDNIDKFMVLVVKHESSSCSRQAHGIRKLIDKCNSLLPDLKIRRKIAKEVKYIKIQLKEVSDRFSRYKIDGSSSLPAKDKVDPRLRAVYKDATELVGIDGPRDELVKWLTEKEGESLKFVSIVGYGGLGKTTLATQIRANLGLGATKFECGAFVSISRKPDIKAILRSILSQITKQDSAYSGLDDVQLIMATIQEFLQDKRYFIIIDDIWELRTWKTLKCAFVNNTCGSRVVITTRIVDVAKSCSPSNEDLVYEMKPLSEADSKKLFFKRIFSCEESCPDSLKEASKDILKECRGLPLAINAISSLLATTRETKEEWDRVRHSIRSSKAKSDIIETMNYILSLSYFDLPHHLRSCILYLALFPEDELIQRQRLVRRWISEGFIHGESGQDLMELGDEYFHELVNRSLIQPEKIGYDGKVGYCRVHDTILDFLIDKSSQENLCTVLKKQCKPDGIVRRLSLMGSEDEEIVEQLDLSQARSIGAFGDIKRLPSLGKSKSLRVLDLQRCHKLENHHIKDIETLYQLKYLDISFTRITELPRQIGELLYLETLVTSYELSELPKSTTRLRRLARLFVHADCKLPDGLGNLVNLQELDRIDALQLKHVEELGKLTNLRRLKIRLDTDGIEDNKLGQSKEKLVSSLCKLDKCGLPSLSIDYHLGEKDGEEPFLPALGCIHQVSVHGEDIFRISRWLTSLPNLHKLYLFNPKKIEQQDIEMIGLMPNLLELYLALFNIDDARRLIIRCEGFQQLQSFQVYRARMGVLMFEPGAMPRLKELGLRAFEAKPISAAVDFDFGIQRLSSLARLTVTLDCIGWTAAEVKAAEDAFKRMAEANPNRPKLQMTRLFPGHMLQDEQIEMAGSGTTTPKEEEEAATSDAWWVGVGSS